MPQYGRQEAAPQGQLSSLLSSCLSCGSDASSPQGCDSPCCCLGVETKDCIAWRLLAKAVVRCTENICHVWREGERRAHLRSQAVLPFLGLCHLLLVLTAHSHRSGSLLTLNSVQGYTSSPPWQCFSLDVWVPCTAPASLANLSPRSDPAAECTVLCVSICVCLCVWRAEVNFGYCPFIFIYLFILFLFATGLPVA